MHNLCFPEYQAQLKGESSETLLKKKFHTEKEKFKDLVTVFRTGIGLLSHRKLGALCLLTALKLKYVASSLHFLPAISLFNVFPSHNI